uniref:CBF1-interacting co-repressor CIR N-terminal domain-containing protein n=1 Tax=Rhodosorus marinus TaxID=101924 RepID=A0A7S2ZNW7_9RHOD|mmetsp:Transcript_239/g.598  ORF Transcript_239/g.598 Transcript_239/m.598 type:complete len:471 (+) Transcript_239:401-1813(+)|eukprot:CAMPEP_0113962658 /NCGR_PEP_ID=MMETSP0011_2-20120614/6050_1 /TAXON_ID=101924 /ORGANISM="Rhodosorus marinus" /LENGTH=470 /DNA_ID=CAMNT_0000974561 /DNA_START=381 /DNA_END=1793 /DNA_ORIENTATION=- /assembly_acc=CAM_ASM_000156
MSALQFLNNKSWSVAKLNNKEKVWIAEQKAAEEKKKVEELKKKLLEERQLEELKRLEVESGKLDPSALKKDEKIDWMYEFGKRGKEDEKTQEEYLTGQKEAQLSEPAEVVAGSSSGGLLGSTGIRDTAAKLLEDPLMQIKLEEQKAMRNLLSNPVRMEKIRKDMEARKSEKKKAKKKHKKEKKERKDKRDKVERKERKRSREAHEDHDRHQENGHRRRPSPDDESPEQRKQARRRLPDEGSPELRRHEGRRPPHEESPHRETLRRRRSPDDWRPEVRRRWSPDEGSPRRRHQRASNSNREFSGRRSQGRRDGYAGRPHRRDDRYDSRHSPDRNGTSERARAGRDDGNGKRTIEAFKRFDRENNEKARREAEERHSTRDARPQDRASQLAEMQAYAAENETERRGRYAKHIDEAEREEKLYKSRAHEDDEAIRESFIDKVSRDAHKGGNVSSNLQRNRNRLQRRNADEFGR